MVLQSNIVQCYCPSLINDQCFSSSGQLVRRESAFIPT